MVPRPFTKWRNISCGAIFEAWQTVSQHRIESIRNHRQDDVEVDLDHDWGGEGIEIEEPDRLGH